MRSKYFLLLLMFPVSGFTQGAEAVQSLVNAERAFATAAKNESTRQAFIQFLSDSGLIFQPGPVYGKEFWRQAPETDDLLSWRPVFVLLASSGDLGYSTGPWEYRSKRSDTAAIANGYFVSIWRKQNDAWKVELDIGVSFPLNTATESERFGHLPVQGSFGRSPSATITDLLSSERKIIDQLSRDGMTAYEKHVTDDARFYRPGSFPMLTEKDKKRLFDESSRKFSHEVTGSGVSRAGDLGYVYGKVVVATTKDGLPATLNGNYLRIYQLQQGRWKIALDLLNLQR